MRSIKNYIFLFCLLALSLPNAFGQLDAPDFECITVSTAGDVNITWSQPTDPANEFISYELFQYNPGTNTSNSIAVIPNYNTTTYIPPGLDGNAQPYCFFLQTNSFDGTNQTSLPSDTVCSMFLQALPGITPGIVDVAWNFPFLTTLGQPTNGTYTIFMEYPAGTWTEVANIPSDPALNLYQHEVTVCSELLNFQVRYSDGGLCNHFSNIDGDVFQDQLDPSAPIFTSVSVDSLTNDATLAWEPPPQGDVSGYIIYECIPGIPNPVAIDTIFDGSITEWIWDATVFGGTSEADVFSEAFNIAAFDSCFISAGNPDPGPGNLTCTSTIFLTANVNACEDDVNLIWTPYTGWDSGVSFYEIYAQEEPIPFSGVYEPAEVIGIVNGSENTFVHQDATLGSSYRYRVRAYGSGNGYESASNTRVVTLFYPEAPQGTYLSHASVVDASTVQIRVKLDATVGTPHTYILEKEMSFSGQFEPINSQQSLGSNEITFLDTDVETGEVSYTYRILVENSCGDSVGVSNIGKTLLLGGFANKERLVNTINWSPYEEWDEGVSEYQIFRSIDGAGFPVLLDQLNGSETSYEDDVSDLLYTKGEFCYTIVATEEANGISIPDAAVSNIHCITQDPVVWTPNAFVVDGFNRIFIPVISFADFDNYQFEVYSRWGDILFSTTEISEGWDGTSNGTLLPEGLYAYYIYVADGAGRIYEEHGTVTMLINGID